MLWWFLVVLTVTCCLNKTMALSALVPRKQQFMKHCAASLLTHFLCILQPHPTDASTILTNGLFHTGFGITTTHYQSYAHLLSEAGIPTLLVGDVDESDDTALSMRRDAASLLAQDTTKPAGVDTHLLLVGHSRGGAVAALAATQRETDALVLLDPVDTSDGLVTAAIAGGTKVRPPRNVLIVSTPYGGLSSYYHVRYESACAPTGRNGDAFEAAYRKRMQSQSHQVGTLLHVTLPNVGHTQLLDDRQGSVLASVCAVNAAVADDDVRSLIQTLLKEWITSVRITTDEDADNNNNQGGSVSVLVEKITSQFPNIELTYTVNK